MRLSLSFRYFTLFILDHVEHRIYQEKYERFEKCDAEMLRVSICTLRLWISHTWRNKIYLYTTINFIIDVTWNLLKQPVVVVNFGA